MIYTATRPFLGDIKQYYPKAEVLSSLLELQNAKLLIFTGGEDINPRLYGQYNTYSTFNSERDAAEVKIFTTAMNYPNIKILGICRGHQLIMALYYKLVLIQDLFLQEGIFHGGSHEIASYPHSTIGKYFPKKVNSYHHQGAFGTYGGRLKNGGFVSSSYHEIIESTEGERIITTQFHPEFMGEESREFFEYIYKWSGN
jgi:putative glutamine amidotransferase